MNCFDQQQFLSSLDAVFPRQKASLAASHEKSKELQARMQGVTASLQQAVRKGKGQLKEPGLAANQDYFFGQLEENWKQAFTSGMQHHMALLEERLSKAETQKVPDLSCLEAETLNLDKSLRELGRVAPPKLRDEPQAKLGRMVDGDCSLALAEIAQTIGLAKR